MIRPKRNKAKLAEVADGLEIVAFDEEAPAGQWALDVVFVHGLDGHPVETWSHDGTQAGSWPAWIAEYRKDVSVSSVGYNVSSLNWRGSAMPLQDRAISILSLLDAKGFGERPICFIGHSMGGLVIKQMLFQAAVLTGQYRGIAESTVGVVFISTPHTGSSVATNMKMFGGFLRPTKAVGDLVADDGFLRMLNDWYRGSPDIEKIEHLVFYENLRTKGVMVVDASSANPGLVGVTPIRIDADHVSVCKPRYVGSPLWIYLDHYLTGLIEDLHEESLDSVGNEVELSAEEYGSDLRSTHFSDRTVVEISNRMDKDLDIYWINYDGEEEFWKTVSSGDKSSIETFASHVWLVVDQSVDRELGVYVMRATLKNIVVVAGYPA